MKSSSFFSAAYLFQIERSGSSKAIPPCSQRQTDRQVQELTGKTATFAIASVGVGSWAQAVVMHYKTPSARATVATVEPDTAARLQASLRAGKITTVDTADSIMCVIPPQCAHCPTPAVHVILRCCG